MWIYKLYTPTQDTSHAVSSLQRYRSGAHCRLLKHYKSRACFPSASIPVSHKTSSLPFNNSCSAGKPQKEPRRTALRGKVRSQPATDSLTLQSSALRSSRYFSTRLSHPQSIPNIPKFVARTFRRRRSLPIGRATSHRQGASKTANQKHPSPKKSNRINE